MTPILRHLLLAALLLRALVPAGWMPGSAALGQAAWIICGASGAIHHGTPGSPAPDESHHQPCAFATAHIVAMPHSPALAAPTAQAVAFAAAAGPRMPLLAPRFTPALPRGPPFSA